jgi:hypothetical protein
MKQINPNPIRKQFGPVPIFSIAASIIMVTTSVSSLHSQGSGFVVISSGIGGLDAHRMMLGDDTRGDVWTVVGTWHSLACGGGAAGGKFVDLRVEG